MLPAINVTTEQFYHAETKMRN